MSKYMAFETETFADGDLLVAALSDLGFDKVVRGKDLSLEGWDRGDKRVADIVVRRKDVGDRPLLGDMGFQRTAAGYIAVVDDMDLGYKLGRDFIQRLQTSYHERAAQKMAKRLGGTVLREVFGKTIKIRIKY